LLLQARQPSQNHDPASSGAQVLVYGQNGPFGGGGYIADGRFSGGFRGPNGFLGGQTDG